MAKSSAYAVMMHVDVDVLKWYPRLSFSSHRSRDSRYMINRYGQSVSPCMVPWLIFIGGVVPKVLSAKDVVEFLYVLPTISTASMGKSRSSMRASRRAWSMDPKALRKSMYVRWISLVVSLTFSRAAMIIWICRDVFRCGRKSSWLKYNIVCCFS